MYGMRPQRRGMFGTMEQRPAMPGMGDPGQGFPTQAPEPAQERGKVNWGGIAADFLAGLGGREGPYLAQLQARQAEERKERDYQRRRQDENTDRMTFRQWDRDNPLPQQPDSFARTLEGAGIMPGTPEYGKLMRQRAEALANPVQWVTGEDGIPRPLPRAINSTQPTFTEDDWNGGAAPTAGAPPLGGSGQSTQGLFKSLVQQESGGRVGAVGPQTKYGRALGLTQMLPATAQEMAGKLGMAWHPELMTAKTPAAARYQLALGKAYFDEGLSKTGNARDALHYYHGGPNRGLWGPKTRRYAEQVLARAGGR